MRRAGLILALAVGLAVAAGLTGCGGGSSSASTSATSPPASTPSTTASAPSTTASVPSTTASVPAKHACRTVRVPSPKPNGHLKAPHLTLDPHKTYTVKIVTNCGSFAFALDVAHSPKTSASFYYLVKRGFFDGLTFHRVAAGFVIQGGDPTGTGAGGAGYTVVEAPPKNTQYVLGDVAMAKTEAQPAGASGSQFFIVTAANVTQSAGLTPDYALVGKVTSGIGVVEKIGSLPTNPPQDGAPTTPVVMSSVTVSTG